MKIWIIYAVEYSSNESGEYVREIYHNEDKAKEKLMHLNDNISWSFGSAGTNFIVREHEVIE